ncbi:anti-sigma factor [Agarilytica rhodophyticola]|uniref:anti-sigma factor n=1 Tax=Agarilytica rhodophyticola TaxID=1737490 RepID=UPI000B349A95|nr:anti-sigma factor [Agarilytica rhodophyticola]
MSRNEDRNDGITTTSLAFEYVSGILRGEERDQVQTRLQSDESLRAEVRFWEEQLMAIQSQEERPPMPSSWDAIVDKINAPKHEPTRQQVREQESQKTGFSWANFWQWGAPTFAAIALMFVMFGYNPITSQTSTPNTDYVAVLTDNSGKALLTALTAQEGKSMWLKWEIEQLDEDSDAQLWAVSKRDGEIRPITVLENTKIEKLELSEANWRLITDASYLLLTKEEEGGSAIDEPSDILLAKGFCVRFSQS